MDWFISKICPNCRTINVLLPTVLSLIRFLFVCIIVFSLALFFPLVFHFQITQSIVLALFYFTLH